MAGTKTIRLMLSPAPSEGEDGRKYQDALEAVREDLEKGGLEFTPGTVIRGLDPRELWDFSLRN
jgi:hypothetical protein